METNVKVSILKDYENDDYERYILNKDNVLIYASTKYRQMLEQLLNDRSCYLIAKENNSIVGVLPCFIRESNKYGNVLNSLPFYGSTGAVICDEQRVKEKLLAAYCELSRKYHCVATTIVTSPFESENELYRKALMPQFIDERIGQMTFLPGEKENANESLLSAIDAKTRNCIKKAQKSGVLVEIDNSTDNMDFLYKLHLEGMEKIGGLSKKKKFFDLVQQIFEQGVEYNIFTAKLGKEKIASCLCLYYNNTVEYFVPATKDGYRIYQPLSLIIYEAMKEAMSRGFKKWNWGGTWLTQQGVYNFKKKWATTDLPYYYYINIYDKSILRVHKEDILAEFENYYVYPFDRQGEQ